MFAGTAIWYTPFGSSVQAQPNVDCEVVIQICGLVGCLSRSHQPQEQHGSNVLFLCVCVEEVFTTETSNLFQAVSQEVCGVLSNAPFGIKSDRVSFLVKHAIMIQFPLPETSHPHDTGSEMVVNHQTGPAWRM